jgi:hypothetical protein
MMVICMEVTMSEPVRHLLELFETLQEADKRSVVAELLRRNPPSEDDIPASGFDALADELFANLDAEEAARATDR